MPFDIPSFEQVRNLLLAAMGGRFPNANLNRHGDLYKRLSVVALGILDNHYHLRQVELDLRPDTAEGVPLDRLGSIWGVPRKGAAGATGSAALRVFGDVGATVPTDELLRHTSSGLEFESRSGGTIPSAGFSTRQSPIYFPEAADEVAAAANPSRFARPVSTGANACASASKPLETWVRP